MERRFLSGQDLLCYIRPAASLNMNLYRKLKLELETKLKGPKRNELIQSLVDLLTDSPLQPNKVTLGRSNDVNLWLKYLP